MPSLRGRRRHAATSSSSQYGIRSSSPCDGIWAAPPPGAGHRQQPQRPSHRDRAHVSGAGDSRIPRHDFGCRLVVAPAGGDAPLDSGDRRRAAAVDAHRAAGIPLARHRDGVSDGWTTTARALLHEGLVHDLYLTTSSKEGGEPDTPLLEGALNARAVVVKMGTGLEEGVRFVHYVLRSA